MNHIFQPFLRKFILVFFDDILIYSKSLEEHYSHLRTTLQILQQHKLYAKQSKCSFGNPIVHGLGHVISKDGVSVDQSKVECILHWPIPKTLKTLRGFLGLTGYYKKFIRNYGPLAQPLTQLLKKDAFHWNLNADTAFQELKIAMSNSPVLSLPDFTKPFIIECDASRVGVGDVLMQEGRPLAFLSHALSEAKRSLSIYDKELFALVIAIHKWRPYLLGSKFKVCTDHHSLKFLLKQRVGTPSQQQWLAKLLGYEFDVEYRSGNTN